MALSFHVTIEDDQLRYPAEAEFACAAGDTTFYFDFLYPSPVTDPPQGAASPASTRFPLLRWLEFPCLNVPWTSGCRKGWSDEPGEGKKTDCGCEEAGSGAVLP